MEILREIEILLKEEKHITKKITLETKIKSLGLDSLDLMDLIIASEKKFNVLIDDDVLMNIKTFKDLVDCLENKINNK